jgi:Rhs element Vgr protein
MTAPTIVPTAATPDVCTIEILVDGEAVPSSLQVRGLVVSRELNRVPSASIEIDDGRPAEGTFPASSAETFAPGRRVEIQLGYRSSNDAVFKGVVTRQRIRVRKNGAALHVDCHAEAVRMTAVNRSRCFADAKDSDAMEQVLDANGLAREVEATAATQREVVQYDSTDWDFLLSRAEANGQVVLAGDDGIRIAKPAFGGEPALELAFGATVLELDAELDARWQSKGVKATSWSAADQEAIEVEASEPAPPEAGDVSAADLARVMGDEVSALRHMGAIDEPQLQAWADARLMRMRLARLRGRARCQGFAGVLPDRIIRLSGVGGRFEGALYVSGVRHMVAGGNWETDVQFGLGPEIFAETVSLRPPPAAGLLPAAGGLQTAVVTALENDPDGEERIRCRLPMVAEDDEGQLARLATLDAGDGRGTYFRPEIGDEVVVGFLDDDPRAPVILGMVHSSARPAPEPAKDDNHLKGYVSREKLRLAFDDEKKAIGLETPGGNRILLSEDAKGIAVEDQNGNRIVLDDSGVTIKSAKDLALEATGDVTVNGKNVTLAAQQAFKASGYSSAEVSGAQATISGDATTTIRGRMVKIN